METYTIVITTTSAQGDDAKKIIHALLNNKLAACIQICKINSSYVWKGDICNEDENVLFIKCKKSDYKEIEKTIKEIHSYEVPEIIQIPITNGLKSYLDWISSNTR